MDKKEYETAMGKLRRKWLRGMALSSIPGVIGAVGIAMYNNSHPITTLPEKTQAIVSYQESVKTLPLLEDIADEVGIPMAEVVRVRNYIEKRGGEDDIESYDTQLALHLEEQSREDNRIYLTAGITLLLTSLGFVGVSRHNGNKAKVLNKEYDSSIYEDLNKSYI